MYTAYVLLGITNISKSGQSQTDRSLIQLYAAVNWQNWTQSNYSYVNQNVFIVIKSCHGTRRTDISKETTNIFTSRFKER